MEENKEKSIEEVLKEIQESENAKKKEGTEEKKQGQELNNLKEVLSQADSQANKEDEGKDKEPQQDAPQENEKVAAQEAIATAKEKPREPTEPLKNTTKKPALRDSVQKLDEIIKRFKEKKE